MAQVESSAGTVRLSAAEAAAVWSCLAAGLWSAGGLAQTTVAIARAMTTPTNDAATHCNLGLTQFEGSTTGARSEKRRTRAKHARVERLSRLPVALQVAALLSRCGGVAASLKRGGPSRKRR